MRIIATDQHQQPILFRHVDDIGNGYYPVPTLGNNLKLRRQPKLWVFAILLANLVVLPFRQGNRRGD